MYVRNLVLCVGILLCVAGSALAEKHALLIGVGEYVDVSVEDLEGPPNDVEVLKDLLVEKWAFKEKKITTLVDGAAGRDAILSALDKIASRLCL